MDGLKALIGTVRVDVAGFDVAETWFERVVVLAAAGELDMLTAPQLQRAIAAAAKKHPAAMIVDLTQVIFLASAGLNVLLAAYRDITPSARFGIVAAGVAVRRPLKLTGIDSLVMLYPALNDALANIAGDLTGAPT
jgi:anti-sigma B factor antagonist